MPTKPDDPRLSDGQLEIVRFCAIECELQCSGERSVWRMVQAWTYAQGRAWLGLRPEKDDVLSLAMVVEPAVNAMGYRQINVRVGEDVKIHWEQVPRQMERLLGSEEYEPESWFREYEEIHPFGDGNGRTGQILYNWLSGTLEHPRWAPDFWGDPRRRPGEGAPGKVVR